jgi:hypothetical protein
VTDSLAASSGQINIDLTPLVQAMRQIDSRIATGQLREAKRHDALQEISARDADVPGALTQPLAAVPAPPADLSPQLIDLSRDLSMMLQETKRADAVMSARLAEAIGSLEDTLKRVAVGFADGREAPHRGAPPVPAGVGRAAGDGAQAETRQPRPTRRTGVEHAVGGGTDELMRAYAEHVHDGRVVNHRLTELIDVLKLFVQHLDKQSRRD